MGHLSYNSLVRPPYAGSTPVHIWGVETFLTRFFQGHSIRVSQTVTVFQTLKAFLQR